MVQMGYITRDEYCHYGSRVFQYSKTRTKNLAVPIADLKPLGHLFEQVKEWEAAKF
jgi:hypothetical protein